MNKVEIESLSKSFLLFFTSLTLLIATLVYINYTKEIKTLDDKILSEMRVCSFNLKCKKFEIDFVDRDTQKLYTLEKEKKGVTSYYPIPKSQQYYMRFTFTTKNYQENLQNLKNNAIKNFLAVLVVIFILSILFSFYALHPLRSALLLTQEFIKDILHDFNTPLSALRLNSSMLKKELPNNTKIKRIEQSVENVLNLQQHLRSYLQNSTSSKTEFDLKETLLNSIYMLEKNHPSIKFNLEMQSLHINTNQDAMKRIIDNILSNSAKYNKQNGSVTITYDIKTKKLYIQDTGIGIKNPKKIFDRFYKENDRGIGIGLHIVKKLCDELNINIGVKSTLNVGTEFTINLSKLTLS